MSTDFKNTNSNVLAKHLLVIVVLKWSRLSQSYIDKISSCKSTDDWFPRHPVIPVTVLIACISLFPQLYISYFLIDLFPPIKAVLLAWFQNKYPPSSPDLGNSSSSWKLWESVDINFHDFLAINWFLL